ncbi:MAG: M28 family peptidase [Pseudomonadales bacterium]
MRVALAFVSILAASYAMAAGIERSRPNAPSNAEMLNWASAIVEITEQYPQFRRIGTPGDAKVRDYIQAQLESIGFDSIEQQSYETRVREYESWSLSVAGKSIPAYFMRGAEYTSKSGVNGTLTYIGEAVDPNADYSGQIVVFDIRGQAVPGAVAEQLADFVHDPAGTLARGTFGGKGGAIPRNFPVSYYQLAEQGAVAMIGILKDYDNGTNQFYADPSAMVQTRIPGLFLGKHDGAALVKQIASAANTLPATVKVSGRVKKSRSANIVATLNGQKKDTLLINTHHDAGFSGAVQDASGVAAVLGLAKYFSKVPSNFRQKTLVFVFDGSHYDWNYPMGANIFAEQNPEVMANTVLTIGIEHIAQKFKVVDGAYQDTGEVEPRILFTPPNQFLFDLTKRAIVKNGLTDVIVPKPGALTMFGETQSFFLQGYPSFSLISGPEYLFLADDTVEKIATEEFEKVVGTFIDIVDGVMYKPGHWLQRIDRL